MTLGGAGSPRAAAAGAPVTLSGTYISATLPPSLPKTGYDLGIFRAGHDSIPSRVRLAIAAANATPATQVRGLAVTASTTIKMGAGGNFVSGTPIVVRIPIPDTVWAATGSGPVSFSQAGAGSLPSLPVGLNDQLVPVAGSILVKPKLANLRFVMDCQPGSTVPPFKRLTPALTPPFATLEADRPLPATSSAPAVRVASTKLKRTGPRVAVVIACPAGIAACRGRIALRSVAPVRSAGRARALVVAPGAAYRRDRAGGAAGDEPRGVRGEQADEAIAPVTATAAAASAAPTASSAARAGPIGRRLVEQQHAGVLREHHRDPDALALAAGELVERAVAQRGRVGGGQRPLDALPVVRGLRAPEALVRVAAARHEIADGQPLRRDRRLRQEADAARHLARGELADRRAVEQDAARLRLHQARHRAQQRRLAARVGADDRGDAALRQLAVQSPQDLVPAVGEGDRLGVQRRLRAT